MQSEITLLAIEDVATGSKCRSCKTEVVLGEQVIVERNTVVHVTCAETEALREKKLALIYG